MPSTTTPTDLRDLLDGKVAALTTLGKDGGPQTTLVWFAYDEATDRVKISLNADRLKAKNLLKRPQVSVLFTDPQDQFRFIDVRGAATTEVDSDYAWATAHINPKYGADVRSFDQPGSTRLVVTIEPTNIFSQNGPG